MRGADRSRMADLTGRLIVTVSRLAQDVLKSAGRNRAEYVGPWLPDPLITEAVMAGPAAPAGPRARPIRPTTSRSTNR